MEATLEILDFMPLVSANYSGGIITDWYSEKNNRLVCKNYSKILTNELDLMH